MGRETTATPDTCGECPEKPVSSPDCECWVAVVEARWIGAPEIYAAAEVQRRRAASTSVKRKLRELEISYSMQFPAQLWVVTQTGVEFFTTPQEAWPLLELLPNSGPSGPSQCQKRKRHSTSRSRQPSPGIDPPTSEEAKEEQQWVVVVVASLSGSSQGKMSPSQRVREEQTDSDSETTTSARLRMVLPAVTPGTADKLIWKASRKLQINSFKDL
ncbi:hypothetical protein NDU88_004244 [Pleurodeles waltl]|uniref:Uncharacterized protein n=1 Tax=Pleurodeles waltl TaxID=8319 RepID=A0AAV7W8H1_PLEWA|nr:hypothetical protein NDU88_004244 [Pleurodeles waltl]